MSRPVCFGRTRHSLELPPAEGQQTQRRGLPGSPRYAQTDCNVKLPAWRQGALSCHRATVFCTFQRRVARPSNSHQRNLTSRCTRRRRCTLGHGWTAARLGIFRRTCSSACTGLPGRPSQCSASCVTRRTACEVRRRGGAVARRRGDRRGATRMARAAKTDTPGGATLSTTSRAMPRRYYGHDAGQTSCAWATVSCTCCLNPGSCGPRMEACSVAAWSRTTSWLA